MQQQERSKMLGTMPMNKLVPKVAVPIMISMLVQALYNVVDGIFVARYSADAFTAVSLVFPVQMLMIAVSTGLGVGINSLISRRLGEKRGDAALDAAKHGIFLELCDVLIDGPFILEKRNLDIRFKGSENQRIIDVPASLRTGVVVLKEDGRWIAGSDPFAPGMRERV